MKHFIKILFIGIILDFLLILNDKEHMTFFQKIGLFFYSGLPEAFAEAFGQLVAMLIIGGILYLPLYFLFFKTKSKDKTNNQYKENYKTSKSEPTFQNYNSTTKNSYSINKKLANESNTTQTYGTCKTSSYIPTIICPNCKESNNNKNEFCWKCKSKLNYRKKVQDQNYQIDVNVDNFSNKPNANSRITESKIEETKKDKPIKNTIFKNEDEIYEKIMLEIEEDNKVKSTWAKTLVEANGDKNKEAAIYIKLRFDELKKNF